MTLPDTEEIPRILNLDDVKELQFALAHADAMEDAMRKSPNRVKVRVLMLSIYYPLAMCRYFEKALKNNPRVDLKTVGPYTASWIPWMGGMNLLEKYAKSPDISLPFKPDVGRVNYEFVQTQLGDWKPDIVLCVDAGINWAHKPKDGVVVTVGTDPHVDHEYPDALKYAHARKISDKFFNMQKCYSEKDDIYLPYAWSAYDHYVEVTDKDADAVLIGMPYEQRIQWVNELRKHGVSVIFENAPVFDEYRALANRACIGLNWSSMNDLNARFFETPAFGLAPVMNRVPDAHLFLTEDEDYLGFSNLGEGVEKVLYLKDKPDEIVRLSTNAHRKIQGHTYDKRVEQILEECGF